MMPQVLVTDLRCEGKQVAFRSFTDNTVIAYGNGVKIIIEETRSCVFSIKKKTGLKAGFLLTSGGWSTCEPPIW
jgi:hypothetical protein